MKHQSGYLSRSVQYSSSIRSHFYIDIYTTTPLHSLMSTGTVENVRTFESPTSSPCTSFVRSFLFSGGIENDSCHWLNKEEHKELSVQQTEINHSEIRIKGIDSDKKHTNLRICITWIIFSKYSCPFNPAFS